MHIRFFDGVGKVVAVNDASIRQALRCLTPDGAEDSLTILYFHNGDRLNIKHPFAKVVALFNAKATEVEKWNATIN